MSLKNTNFVITGGSKGIGKAIALELASKGANLALIARKKKDLDIAKAEILNQYPQTKIELYSADVSKYADVKKTALKIYKSMGKIRGLINNAGFGYPEIFEKKPIKKFEETIQVKYFGSVYMTRECLPFLEPGAHITFTASVLGYMGLFGYSSYVGPNFALIGFAETLDQELMDRNLKISVLCPPDTDTPGFETENKTKPYETHEISKSAKLMESRDVARKFIKKMLKGKFIITVNFESAMLYRLHGIMPGLFRGLMKYTIRNIQRKK